MLFKENPFVTKPEEDRKGMKEYYRTKIEEYQQKLRAKRQNLKRLEAQRNELNDAVKRLKEEISLLEEPGSHVGEVVKLMGKNKALVKLGPEGKYRNTLCHIPS